MAKSPNDLKAKYLSDECKGVLPAKTRKLGAQDT